MKKLLIRFIKENTNMMLSCKILKKYDVNKVNNIILPFDDDKYINKWIKILITKRYNKTSKEMFIEFLKEMNSYDKFETNLKNNLLKKSNTGYDSITFPYFEINSLCKYLDVPRYIVMAFVWENTDEGYYFWEKLNDKWCTRYDGMIKQIKREYEINNNK